MSFPFETEINESDQNDYQPVREYEYDFQTGQLTGKIVEGLEAIKVWVYLALNSARYQHVIYSWNYGNDLEELIGTSHTHDYLDTELPRLIEDCLLINRHIKSITDMELTLIDDKLAGSFTVNTDYGKVDMNV